jgi:two-component system phosphate regulon response regulator PhoB
MRRVLLIDDEPRAAQALECALGSGVEVHALNCAADVARLGPESRPDLILLDIALGGDSGLEICRQLRLDERFRNVPVVLLSGLQG